MPSTELVTQSRDLVPFKGRRPTWLDDANNLKMFCELLVGGQTLREIGEIFGISEWSCGQYKKDPRVKAECMRQIEDRVYRVTRIVDTKIEARLREADELDTDTLLKIRKEFLGGALRLQTQGTKADSDTINSAMDEIESNPAFAAELSELLERQQQPVKV
jgi:hypothetical protein